MRKLSLAAIVLATPFISTCMLPRSNSYDLSQVQINNVDQVYIGEEVLFKFDTETGMIKYKVNRSIYQDIWNDMDFEEGEILKNNPEGFLEILRVADIDNWDLTNIILSGKIPELKNLVNSYVPGRFE